MALQLINGSALLAVRVPPEELLRRFAAVLEGGCPHGHGPLERLERCGWCSTCNVGWSVRGGAVTMHFRIARCTIERVLGRRAGP